MTYRELYTLGCEALKNAGIEEASWDARLLLETICHTDRNYLLVHGEQPVTEEQQNAYLHRIEKRAQRIPLQHITGVQEFMGLEFAVNEHVLIPRQDTEILVEEVLKELHDGMRVLDMCTGSGCIITSLMHYSNDCKGVGVDISEEALAVARENAERIQKSDTNYGYMEGELTQSDVDRDDSADAETTSCRLQFIQSDLFQNVIGQYEIIVSNPPYIQSAVIETLMPEVKDYEPRLALDGTEDGLFFYRRIVAESRDYLTGGGMLYFEIGHDQAESVKSLMQEAGFAEINVVKDYAGLDRVVYGTYIK